MADADQGGADGANGGNVKKAAIPVDRASESVVNPPSVHPPPVIPAAVPSGDIEIPPESFAPAAVSTGRPPSFADDAPPSVIIANAMQRGRPVMPLRTLVGIGAGIFVVLVALSLLLFR
jgi:hypothetical protein